MKSLSILYIAYDWRNMAFNEPEELIRRLERDGLDPSKNEITVVHIGSRTGKNLISEKVTVHSFRFRWKHVRPISDFLAGLKALSLCRRNKYDVVVTADSSLLWWIVFLKTKTQVVLYLNTLHRTLAKSTGRKARYFFILLSEYICRRYISHCMVLSTAGYDYAMENLKLSKESIHYFLPKTFKDEVREVEVDIRKKYGIPADAFLLLSLSRLEKEKGVDRLVGYLSGIADTYCLIVGSGSQENLLRSMAAGAEKEKVIFAGAVPHDESAQYIKAANVLVQLSRSESLGLSVIEAMEKGVPVIASPVGGLCDSIGLGNERGFLVSDQTSFIRALQEIRDNTKEVQEKITRAKEYVAARISLFQSINQIISK